MNATSAKHRFTIVELVVVIVIIAVLVALLIPIVNSAREAGRRACCDGKNMQIGLAFANYASTYNNCFPPSAALTKAADGSTRTVGGWSHLVRILPFMEYNSLYQTLPADGDPEDTSNPTIVAVTNTQMREFVCPSAPRNSARRQSAGITSYKAMGATTRDSLAMVANRKAKPPYGTMSPIQRTIPLHPDGAIYPSASNLPAADILDGLSHTIFIMETMDEAASRWTVGKEVTLVGLPQSSSPTGTEPNPPHNFFAPPGFDGKWGPESGVAKAGLRTFLSYDFSPTGADAGKYEDPGFGQTPPAYGPSSSHPAVVICGFGDGSTQNVSKQVDAANLFFLITKNGKDPFYIPYP